MSLRKAVYDLMNDVSANIYAIAAPQELSDPYSVFTTRMEVVRSQDGIFQYEMTVSVNVYSEVLSTCVTLADSIRAGVENASGTYDTETLSVGLILSESDDYIENLDKYIISQEYLLKFD